MPTDLWRTGPLCLCRRGSPFFHGVAVCCGRAQSGHAADARPRIPEYSRRFMIAPGSGSGIVSAQTIALEVALLLDYVVGQRQQRRRNIDAERVCGFAVDS
jgi:hypothetical protein